MVWAGICATGKTPLVFIDSGVKIRFIPKGYSTRCRSDLGPTAFWSHIWIFQQDSALSHRAKATQERMVSIFFWSQSARLQCVVDFGGQGMLCKAPWERLFTREESKVFSSILGLIFPLLGVNVMSKWKHIKCTSFKYHETFPHIGLLEGANSLLVFVTFILEKIKVIQII